MSNSVVTGGEGPTLGKGNSSAGAFICEVGTQAEVTIVNCYVVSSIIGNTDESTIYAGGFIGYCSGDKDTTISDSTISTSEIKAKKVVGGFIGLSGLSGKLSINLCKVESCTITSVRVDTIFETGVVVGKVAEGVVTISYCEDGLSANELIKSSSTLSDVSGDDYVYGTTFSPDLSINGEEVDLTITTSEGLKQDSCTTS